MRYWPLGAKWQRVNDDGELEEKTNKIPALVFAARNNLNKITAVQRIYLDENGGKNQFMKAAKLSAGIMKGSATIIQKGLKNGKLYITEGPETGASVAMADPNARVLVSFGVSNINNLTTLIKNLNPKEVIIAADNDGVKKNNIADTKNTTEKAAHELRAAGLNVQTIYPKGLPGLDKTDWNDVLKTEGIASVRSQLHINNPLNLNHDALNFESKKIDLQTQRITFNAQNLPDLDLKLTNTNPKDSNSSMADYSDYFEFSNHDLKTYDYLNKEMLKEFSIENSKTIGLKEDAISHQQIEKSIKIQEKSFEKELEI